ncbi:MAG TPA: sulfite exporter TauE/SafE family protein [Pontiellaceae bacterium]|nr:sulfite exporter TauE/SafE family protein [Pontiellaceae bacterium]HPR83778.1 sulfite exporter TauE/SafE family protein [Pontiellaceae bacterium]
MENWYLYIIAGLAAGIMSSLFGVGGGVLIVPILALGFSFGQKSAQGMSLFIMLPIALAGAIRYKLNPDVPINLPVCGLMALGGIAGAMLGTHLVFGISDIVLKRIFAVFIILTGIHMIVKSFSAPAGKELSQQQIEDKFTEGNNG